MRFRTPVHEKNRRIWSLRGAYAHHARLACATEEWLFRIQKTWVFDGASMFNKTEIVHIESPILASWTIYGAGATE